MNKSCCLRNILLILLLLHTAAATAQERYWQQRVDTEITVALNDQEHSLTGDIQMRYYNESPDTLTFIWMHLWPNAYKNDRSELTKQLVEQGSTDFYFSKDDDRGYINRIQFSVDGMNAASENHPQHQEIVKLLLPKPLLPGRSVEITTPFYLKLPYNFSRSGHVEQSYQITQWYPKPAVYDKKGWHEMPYLNQGEFYNSFGSYRVSITTPAEYVVAATGKKTGETITDSLKTQVFQQNNITDFAWFADKKYVHVKDTVLLNNRIVEINVYHYPSSEKYWKAVPEYVKKSLRTKSAWIGEYPYPVVSLVEHPLRGQGGMEYPTITLISTEVQPHDMDDLVNHEVGHNWFQAILASNERQHPWMDEGMTSYYDRRYRLLRSDPKPKRENFFTKRTPREADKLLLQTLIQAKKDQPIETPSAALSMYNYQAVIYGKAADWMEQLEKTLGTVVFDSLMRRYYSQYRFKHPYPEDFQKIVAEVTGDSANSLFQLLHQKGPLEPAPKKNLKVMSFLSLKDTDRYNYLFLAPAYGYNQYDRHMVGAILHNYTLPIPKLKFVLVPLYSTASKELNGIGRIGYTHYLNNGSSVETYINGARFNRDQYTDSTGKKNFMSFQKLAPSIRYTLAPAFPGSSLHRYIEFKHFRITETDILFTRDPSTNQFNITYPKNTRYLNQLTLHVENNRTLYPYAGSLVAEQGKEFLRMAFTGNYFLNYEKQGGLNVRLFAGKFIYTGDKTVLTQFNTERYHLNMTGPNGNEDYTYNNYFFERNAFDGFGAQQIMMRDGGFKVRTNLLSNKVGKTDNWLAAINLTSTIPRSVNPLTVLPVELPIRIFADIGTYAEAWEESSGNDRLLYNAGVQLTIARAINIYIPILYSKVYRDYIKSTIPEKRFLKTISFSINFNEWHPRKWLPQFPL